MKCIIGKHLFKVQHKTYVFAQGISSECGDKYHCLFLDFDGYELSKVEVCCRILQRKFGVGTFYIFQSDKNAYHAMCISKFLMREILWMQDFIGIEKNYIALCYRRSHWTLRVSGKGKREAPFHILTLSAPTKRYTSSAHAKWLNVYHKIDVQGSDDLSKLVIERYATFPVHIRQNDKVL
jgi:hypothetical protein